MDFSILIVTIIAIFLFLGFKNPIIDNKTRKDIENEVNNTPNDDIINKLPNANDVLDKLDRIGRTKDKDKPDTVAGKPNKTDHKFVNRFKKFMERFTKKGN